MDPIKYILEKLALIGWIAWWQVLPSEFDIVYVTQKAIKGSALADYLAQQPINDYQPMHPEFLDEVIMTFFKGEVEDKDRDKWIMLGFECTNNIAEYKACALGIQATIHFKVKLLKVYIRKLIGFFDDISFHHIPREENQMANALATLASMFQLTSHRDLPYIKFRCCGKPTHCCLIEEEQDGKPWYFDIK
ncbi:uncharacterized protein LOC114391506 [Glycine soja]|uniref:uncharacterized protein n=1 Tax=Glycine max TaxID=3847 RepID=UPI0003DE77D5|nr:uncharacterized protein LOC112999920 [Glycine max]XP_028208311.1 uncharacterized protein LOC114391506 [Glycine soja]|eukprot:XP_025982125.1 uncharacterized protein LOC112999920 [Glycine max]